jgi:hypothetical protein
MSAQTTIEITTTLPCGCEVRFGAIYSGNVDSVAFLLKHVADIAPIRFDEMARNHTCEGGHAD